jgi:hypothetical protein
VSRFLATHGSSALQRCLTDPDDVAYIDEAPVEGARDRRRRAVR